MYEITKSIVKEVLVDKVFQFDIILSLKLTPGIIDLVVIIRYTKSKIGD